MHRQADQLSPLGDSAVLVRLADETQAVALARRVRAAAPAWLVDVVPAYRSVGVYFDLLMTDQATVTAWLSELTNQLDTSTVQTARDSPASPPIPPAPSSAAVPVAASAAASAAVPIAASRYHLIPCCYSLGPDLAYVAELLGLAPEEVVALHAGQDYTVYAIGFAPGFAYLGYLPQALCGVPRLARPRLRVEPGSVGLTGTQTGVYPLPRPGGWPLIARTPLVMVDVLAGYFPLAVGDRVRFVPIDEVEYASWKGRRVGDWPGPPA